MKQILMIAFAALLMVACGNAKKAEENKCCNDSTKTACCECPKNMVSIDSLFANQDAFVDKPVSVCGVAIHVCEHSGKNLFVAVDTASEDYIVAKATDKLGVFDKALLNKHVMVFGTFKMSEEESVETHHEKEVFYYIECDSVKECKCAGDKQACCKSGEKSGCCKGQAESGCKSHSESGCKGQAEKKHNCSGH